MAVFLFGISFFVLEIFTFLYYANEESDDVIGGFTKTVQHSIKNISRHIGAVFFKLGTTSQKKQNDSYHVVAIATILAPVSLCEKPNIPICNLLNWDTVSSSEHT